MGIVELANLGIEDLEAQARELNKLGNQKAWDLADNKLAICDALRALIRLYEIEHARSI